MGHEAQQPFLHIALYEPEIAPNTGNLIRLAANCGAALHLVHPLGFLLEDKRLRRAGLDYHEFSRVREHQNFDSLLQAVPASRIFACSTKGSQLYSNIHYSHGDLLLFGPESRGLPLEIRQHPRVDSVVRLPMLANSRSLNLANATSILVYEVWRQLGFPGSA